MPADEDGGNEAEDGRALPNVDDATANQDADVRADGALIAGHPQAASRSGRTALADQGFASTVGGAVHQQAADLGSAVHHVMEHVPLEDAEVDLDRFVAAACVEFPVADPVEVEQLSRNCLRHPAVRRAATADAGRVWRELAVIAQDGEATTVGRIGLLFEDAGQLVLVDYKTDRIGAGEITLLNEHHAGQMAAYAASLRAATGMRLTRTEIVPARVFGSGKPKDDDAH